MYSYSHTLIFYAKHSILDNRLSQSPSHDFLRFWCDFFRFFSLLVPSALRSLLAPWALGLFLGCLSFSIFCPTYILCHYQSISESTCGKPITAIAQRKRAQPKLGQFRKRGRPLQKKPGGAYKWQSTNEKSPNFLVCTTQGDHPILD